MGRSQGMVPHWVFTTVGGPPEEENQGPLSESREGSSALGKGCKQKLEQSFYQPKAMGGFLDEFLNFSLLPPFCALIVPPLI